MTKAIPVCVHFRAKGNNFIQHPKFTFTLIEKLIETGNVSETALKRNLKLRENF